MQRLETARIKNTGNDSVFRERQRPDKMQSCALNAGDNLCADSMKDFFEIGCNIMDNMAHKFNPHINI